MLVQILDKDLAVIDRGVSRSEGENRFTVIVDDEGKNFTDGYDGGSTPYGKALAAYYMDSEAYKHGAEQVVKGSTCVVGGDINVYGDDKVELYNAGEKALVDKALGNLLIREGLAKKS